MDKAWAFYRRSTDKQELSIEDQRKECQAYAALKGWHIVKEFLPQRGYGSGLTIDRDPQFQEMIRLAEMRNHDVKYLIVYDVSRFGRLCPEDKIYWEQRFKKQGGIQIVYVKDDFKNDGSFGDMITKVVKHEEAHQYSVKLSRDTLRGCKSHAAMGHSTGGKAPYGYNRLLINANENPVKELLKGEHKADKMQRVIWTPSPSESVVLQSIFEMYDSGKGLFLIADDLDKFAFQVVQDQITKSEWKKELKPLLLTAIDEQYGTQAENRTAKIQKRLDSLNNQISNIIDAIKMGRFSETLVSSLQKVEEEREAVREQLKIEEARKSVKRDVNEILEEIIAFSDDFEELWDRHALPEERKEFLKAFIHQITVNHSPEQIRATYYLYKIPQTQQTPAINGLSPFTTGVNCGGWI